MCSGLLLVLLLCNNESFVNLNTKCIYYRRLDVFRFVVNLSVRNFRSIYGLSALTGSGNKCDMSSVTIVPISDHVLRRRHSPSFKIELLPAIILFRRFLMGEVKVA